jgi:putative endonuclease
MHQTKILGCKGETLVAQYLEQQGFRIIATNYTSRFGEIDIIAEKGDVVAFVEVKTRKKVYFSIASVVTPAKQKKIIKTAKCFLMKHGISERVFRFDVATVVWGEEGKQIDYIPNAFYGG